MAKLVNGISPIDELILSEKRQRDQKRMWAAVNMRYFADKYGWTDDERDELADMLGLTGEMVWVVPPMQPTS
jgi:hypothetical protein